MYSKKIFVLGLMLVSMISMVFVGCSEVEEAKTNDTSIKKAELIEDVDSTTSYVFPFEDEKHEGTWLQWPHNYTYGKGFKEKLDPIWVDMTRELARGENVHLIVYNEKEKDRVEGILLEKNVDMDKIDFFIYKTDDVWVRDNGPIFVYDSEDNLVMVDWGFNGWGDKTPYEKCIQIPTLLSEELDIPRIDIQKIVLEGGSVEFDGNGTCMTTRSSVVNENRNPDFSEIEIENYIKKYYGVSNVIWLDGVVGQDITDFHIDGFVKFYDKSTIITMSEDDLLEWGVSDLDITRLLDSKNADGASYEYITLPTSKENVVLENGKKLGYKGSYINYYIANNVVLVPNYNDENDKVANAMLQELYPKREVIGIDVRNLYKDGGMIHCVTQQQPIDKK